MATLTGTKAKSGIQARAGVGPQAVHSEYSASATLSAGDVVQMIKIPKGARVISAQLRTNTLADQGAHLSVGDGVDADRYISASGGTTVAGTSINQSAGEGPGYEYTADDTMDITVVVVGGTATARAYYSLDVIYTQDDSTVL